MPGSTRPSPGRLIAAIVATLFVTFLFLAPAVLAADPVTHTGRVLISLQGDVTLPAGEQADVVMVTSGTATILGDVDTVVAIDGSAVIDGAHVQTVIAIRSPVTLEAGTVVQGDVIALDSTVQKVGDAAVQGEVRGFGLDLVAIGAVLLPIAILFYLGLALVAVVAGLLLAGLAARQVRAAELIIGREPVKAFGIGLVGLIATPIVAILAMVTVIGAPLGLAMLLGVWPLVAFIGYLVAGIAIGEWVLGRTSPQVVHERPYLAAVIGILSLHVLGIVPFVTPIASLFGFGAVLVLAWRTLTHGETGTTAPQVLPAPSAS